MNKKIGARLLMAAFCASVVGLLAFILVTDGAIATLLGIAAGLYVFTHTEVEVVVGGGTGKPTLADDEDDWGETTNLLLEVLQDETCEYFHQVIFPDLSLYRRPSKVPGRLAYIAFRDIDDSHVVTGYCDEAAFPSEAYEVIAAALALPPYEVRKQTFGKVQE